MFTILTKYIRRMAKYQEPRRKMLALVLQRNEYRISLEKIRAEKMLSQGFSPNLLLVLKFWVSPHPLCLIHELISKLTLQCEEKE